MLLLLAFPVERLFEPPALLVAHQPPFASSPHGPLSVMLVTIRSNTPGLLRPATVRLGCGTEVGCAGAAFVSWRNIATTLIVRDSRSQGSMSVMACLHQLFGLAMGIRYLAALGMM